MNIRSIIFSTLPTLAILLTMPVYAEDSVPAYSISGTLPVMYIDTEDHTPITSKEYYLNAQYRLDPMNDSTVEGIGSAEDPQPLQIRGRGNSSWTGGPKKPYKLKLDKKTELLGMPKNKHWALLHPTEHVASGMLLGSLMGLKWTPSYRPVEVVLNGDYIGLYFLTETVRIDKNRVDIFEQEDGETNPELIGGGWLVEIDNYDDEFQIVIPENDKWDLRVTHHSPEELSDQQREWLIDEFTKVNAAIYCSDKTSAEWEEYIDLESMARYFIYQEVMDNPDGFHGSFYMNKDLADDAKWMAGPFWDPSCYCREKTDYTYLMDVHYTIQPHWIGEMVRYPAFCNAVAGIWDELYPSKLEEVFEPFDSIMNKIGEAWQLDLLRWNGTTENFDTSKERADVVKHYLRKNMEWFDKHLPEAQLAAAPDVIAAPEDTSFTVFNLQGLKTGTFQSEAHARAVLPHGLYIANGKKFVIKRN